MTELPVDVGIDVAQASLAGAVCRADPADAPAPGGDRAR